MGTRSEPAGSDGRHVTVPSGTRSALSQAWRAARRRIVRHPVTALDDRRQPRATGFGFALPVPDLVSANARVLARPPAESVFEAGLDWLLDGIEP